MPYADGDCKFHDEWLVEDKYKEWAKDGEPILARCQFCMEIFHARNANSRMNSEKVRVGVWIIWIILDDVYADFCRVFFCVGTCACIIHVL